LGSSELDAEPDDGSTSREDTREEPRRGLDLEATFDLCFAVRRLVLLAAFAFLVGFFFAALRFLAMADNLRAAGAIMLRKSFVKQNQASALRSFS
jgi:hypothetical protein